MNTLILSTSLADHSKSFLLCQKMAELLAAKKVNVTLMDARQLQLLPHHRGPTSDMENLADQVAEADNIIIGMGVYGYGLGDSLKMILDNCFQRATGKFFGILCAAGGLRSFLVPQQLTQVCMNEWSMIQLPKIVYATKEDFEDGQIVNPKIQERMEKFAKEFVEIGGRFLG